ncbi:unnamed protein product [Microthlaspi erraticum]|uniref:Pentatricopeptide repeat-containing protein n=1 Tax=Microthlaspi erraticum TaxID=1685480 RepID=A0A6D2J9U4_9BRAS|nr:unnamed protein product [Microthlaspi erraticum]
MKQEGVSISEVVYSCDTLWNGSEQINAVVLSIRDNQRSRREEKRREEKKSRHENEITYKPPSLPEKSLKPNFFYGHRKPGRVTVPSSTVVSSPTANLSNHNPTPSPNGTQKPAPSGKSSFVVSFFHGDFRRLRKTRNHWGPSVVLRCDGVWDTCYGSACDLCNDLVDSRYIADLGIYNALVKGLCSVKQVDKAYKLFQIAMEEEVEPGFETLSPIMVGYVAMKRLSDFLSLIVRRMCSRFCLIRIRKLRIVRRRMEKRGDS